MSKKNRNQRRQQRRNSPLTSHKRYRNKLTPPLLDVVGDAFRSVNWELDDLPDYLIVAHYLAKRGEPAGVDRFHRLLNVIDAILGIDDPTPTAATTLETETTTSEEKPADSSSPVPASASEASPRRSRSSTPPRGSQSGPAADGDPQAASADVLVFTGRLTDFDKIDEQQRDALLEALAYEGIYDDLIPEELAHVLGMYPDAPANWIVGPWRDRGLTIDPVIAERVLNQILVDAGPRQGDVATWVKSLVCRRHLAAGRTHLPTKEMWDRYTGWPNHEDEDENRAVEAGFRAMYGVLANFQESVAERRLVWSKTFWRSNWKIYTCRWPDEVAFPPVEVSPHEAQDPAPETDEPATTTTDEDADQDTPTEPADYWRQTLTQARQVVDDLRTEFHQLAETTDPDLYDPDRYEVLTGLVGRVLRFLSVFSGYPPLWTMEHGAPLLRTIIETRIVFRYLVQGDDPQLFGKFKAYGMGKLKLLKLHYEDVIDKTEDPPAELVSYVEYLDALVNQDVMEEFQNIDLSGNFAGVDTRKMALSVGLEEAYRLVFAPASANVHGEWSIIDEYVFDRCENPAHRRHRILRRTRDSAVGPNFLQILIDHAGELVDEYETATEERRKFT
jgi:hypothetical protein